MIGRLRPAGAAEVLAGIDVEATIAEIMKKGSLSLKQRTLGASRTPCQMPRVD